MRTLVISFFILLLTSFFTFAFAGAANTDIKCQSTKSDLVITGNVPGSFSEFSLVVKYAGKQAALFSELVDQLMNENATIRIVENLHQGVYTLAADRKAPSSYGYLVLYANPKTVKVKKLANGLASSFEATVSFYLDELVLTSTEEEKVTCSTENSI